MWTTTEHFVSILFNCVVVCTDNWNHVFPVRTNYHHKSLCCHNLRCQVNDFFIANTNVKSLMVINVQSKVNNLLPSIHCQSKAHFRVVKP